MAKPAGARCNLNCDYCFYTPKTTLYPNENLIMSDDVLEQYVKQYIETTNSPEIIFAWQGGEPTLMGVKFFKKALKYQKKYRKEGSIIHNTIQTNGILINDEWCKLFIENDFLVGISIDGPRRLHDAYRKDNQGNPSFEQIMHAIKLMQKYGVDYNILATVNKLNSDHPIEIYKFFKEEVGAQFIQFIPIIELENKSDKDIHLTKESVLPEKYGEFLTTIFDEWVKYDVGKIYVQMFDAALASWVEYPPSVCLFAPTCGTAMIIEFNGDIYSCDHFVDSEHFLGNIMDNPLDEIISSSQQLIFGEAKRDNLPSQCKECDYKFACHGACPKHRFLKDENGENNLNYLCKGYKNFFKHINWPMKIMTSLFNQGRAPAEIMEILNSNNDKLLEVFPGTNHNDPCPCGSGLEFKKCHGQEE